jgi:DNA-binding NarL/FixJ family response regulator
LRTGVAVVLGTAADLEVVGEAADGLRAVELCRTSTPDVVLTDVRMPGVDGIEATSRIVAAGMPARVLVLTTFRKDDYGWRGLRADASGFLLKRASPEQLIEAVRTVAAGDTLLDPSVTWALVEHFVLRGERPGAGSPDRSGLERLKVRELQVLRLVAEDLSNEQIVDLLVIAESTAKTHVKRILLKIDAWDRAQAVVLAYRSGVMAPDR